MNNSVMCSRCAHENPFYNLTCSNCKSYLRDKVSNLDPGKILARLIDSPSTAFRLIIHSEQKNYIVWILFFASVKLLIDSLYMSVAFTSSKSLNLYWYNGYVIVLILFLLYTAGQAYLLTFLLKKNKIVSRYPDNLAILTYSMVPHALAVVLFFVELVVFGELLFSRQPSPFFIKATPAYIFLSFEIVMILWGVFLSIFAVHTQSRNKLFSIFYGLVFNLILFGLLFLISQLIF